MGDCLGDQAVLLVPAARTQVQGRDQRGSSLLQPLAQGFGEQAVVAIPLSLLVEGHQEQVGPLQEVEHGLAPILLPHGITEWRAQSIQDAGLQQEILDIFTLTIQHLFQQVVHDIVMAATERRDEGLWIITTLQGECGELQSGDPAFGTCMQERTLLCRKWKSHRLHEECGRFLLREPEIAGTYFQQVISSTQLRKRKRGIFAGRKDKMHLGRQVLQ